MAASASFPPFEERDAGLLLVFAETGNDVTEEEFHDWYDNEHVPLRVSKFTEFLSAARYKVIASEYESEELAQDAISKTFKSSWSALYTISSNAIFAEPKYTDLREKRSQREADLVKRLAVLDRRIYRLVYDSAAEGAIDISVDSRNGIGPAPANLQPQTKQLTSNIVVATSVTPAASNIDAYNEWQSKEHVGMLKKVPGWKRTRRFQLIDALVNGQIVSPNNSDAKQIPTILGLHEYDSIDFQNTEEYKAAISTPWRSQVMQGGIVQRERRLMQLFKAFEPESALSVKLDQVI